MFCFFRLWWKRSWCANKVYRDMIWEERNLLKQCGNGRMSKFFFFLSLLANKSWLWKFVAPDRFFFHKTEKNYKHFVLILTGELCTIQSQWWANLKTPNLTIVAVCIIVASFFYIWLAFSMATIDILQIFLMFFVFQVPQQNIIVQPEILQSKSTNVEIKSDF